MKFFVETKGASINGAAGMVGNLLAEGNLKLSNLERPGQAVPKGGKYTNYQGGNGIAQWTGIRRTRFEQAVIGDLRYTVDNREEYEDAIRAKGLEAQLEYAWNELKSNYKSSYKAIKSTTIDSSQASTDIVSDFEKPGSYLNWRYEKRRINKGISVGKAKAEWLITKNKRAKLAADAKATYEASLATYEASLTPGKSS